MSVSQGPYDKCERILIDQHRRIIASYTYDLMASDREPPCMSWGDLEMVLRSPYLFAKLARRRLQLYKATRPRT